MMQKAAWMHDHDADPVAAGEAANMAKYAAAEAGLHCLDAAIQTHGGNGMATEYGLADLWGLAAPAAHRAGEPRDDPQLRRPAVARPAEVLLTHGVQFLLNDTDVGYTTDPDNLERLAAVREQRDAIE